MEIDDLRVAVVLDSAVANDSEEEEDVVNILGLSDKLSAAGLTEAGDTASRSGPRPQNHAATTLGTSNEAEITKIAQETCFTVQEVRQKIAGYSGDLLKAKAFFLRCRQMIDTLYARSHDEPLSVSCPSSDTPSHGPAVLTGSDW